MIIVRAVLHCATIKSILRYTIAIRVELLFFLFLLVSWDLVTETIGCLRVCVFFHVMEWDLPSFFLLFFLLFSVW